MFKQQVIADGTWRQMLKLKPTAEEFVRVEYWTHTKPSQTLEQILNNVIFGVRTI